MLLVPKNVANSGPTSKTTLFAEDTAGSKKTAVAWHEVLLLGARFGSAP